MKIGFCFAGQGSQFKGMGQDFYNDLPLVKEIYDKFPEIRDLCFNDENDLINQTAYAQKAMLLTGYAISQAIKNEGITPEYACGLSLGEYTALAYANTWNIEDAISIITYRGELMQNALPLGTTKMAAVIGMSREDILNVITKVSGICEIANYNCPGQIVITGDNEGVNNAMAALTEAGCKRVIELNVSGAFHSSLLHDASLKLRSKLDEYTPNNPDVKIIYNVSGHEENGNINEILEKQICHSVYFEDSIRYMLSNGVDTFVEIGPGKALSGFIKRIDRSAKIYNVSDIEGYKALLQDLKNND